MRRGAATAIGLAAASLSSCAPHPPLPPEVRAAMKTVGVELKIPPHSVAAKDESRGMAPISTTSAFTPACTSQGDGGWLHTTRH